MNQLEATLVMAAIIVLRLAVPLALTFVFGIAMNRLLDNGMVEPES